MRIDPHDARKSAIEDAMIDNANDRAALHTARIKGIREAAAFVKDMGAPSMAKQIGYYADRVEKGTQRV